MLLTAHAPYNASALRQALRAAAGDGRHPRRQRSIFTCTSGSQYASDDDHKHSRLAFSFFAEIPITCFVARFQGFRLQGMLFLFQLEGPCRSLFLFSSLSVFLLFPLPRRWAMQDPQSDTGRVLLEPVEEKLRTLVEVMKAWQVRNTLFRPCIRLVPSGGVSYRCYP